MKKILLCVLLSCVLFKPAQAGAIFDEYSYRIEFDVDRSDYDSKYKGCVDAVENDAVMSTIGEFCQKYKGDIQEIVLVGSASETGLQEHNADLAVKRTDTVVTKLKESTCAEVELRSLSTGKSDYYIRKRNPLNTGESCNERKVDIFIQMKHVSKICEADKIRELWSEDSTVEGLAGVKKLKDACEKGLTNEKIIEILKELAGAPGIPNEVTRIVDVYEILYGIEKDVSAWNLKTSVWKNKEGKFNTARLVSDATAGVVLGTVGSIITSKIIKKNQVKQGFEDLRCVIGGQDVANWGDEFRVGIVTDLK